MKAILKEDIVSYNFRVLSKSGDVVSILYDHDNVKIVENQIGRRFSVHESKLDYEGILRGINEYKKENTSVDSDKGKKSTRKYKPSVKRRNS